MKIRGMFFDAVVGAVCLAGILFLPAFAEQPLNWSPPASGAGRVETEAVVESAAVYTCGIDESTPEPQMPENEPETASEWVEVIPEAEPIIETDVDALIVQIAGEYGLPWELVRAVCWVESGFDPNAVSVTGDYGLMQVSYMNHGTYGLTDPLDPAANLRAGCAILKEKIEQNGGDFTKALMCYNRGDAYAMAQWAEGVFSTAYTEKVLSKYYQYLLGETETGG